MRDSSRVVCQRFDCRRQNRRFYDVGEIRLRTYTLKCLLHSSTCRNCREKQKQEQHSPKCLYDGRQQPWRSNSVQSFLRRPSVVPFKPRAAVSWRGPDICRVFAQILLTISTFRFSIITSKRRTSISLFSEKKQSKYSEATIRRCWRKTPFRTSE